MLADNIVFVGKKPVMAYVTACITCMTSHGGVVTVAARGNTISRVVDVIEVLKRFIQYKVENVEFGTDILEQDGGKRNISTIRVTISKL